MPILQLLQIAAAIATIVTGLISLLRPSSVTGFTGLHPTGPRGITEIRSILGGLFIALGLAPLLLNTPVAYQMLGIAYLGIAVVRAVSMFVLDNSVVQSNSVSLLIEIAFGLILVL